MIAPEKLRNTPSDVKIEVSITPTGARKTPRKVNTAPQKNDATQRIYEILSLTSKSLKLNAILLFLILFKIEKNTRRFCLLFASLSLFRLFSLYIWFVVRHKYMFNSIECANRAINPIFLEQFNVLSVR